MVVVDVEEIVIVVRHHDTIHKCVNKVPASGVVEIVMLRGSSVNRSHTIGAVRLDQIVEMQCVAKVCH